MALAICSINGYLHVLIFFLQFYEKFGKEPKKLGPSKDWNVDLIPKFIMAGGTKDTY